MTWAEARKVAPTAIVVELQIDTEDSLATALDPKSSATALEPTSSAMVPILGTEASIMVEIVANFNQRTDFNLSACHIIITSHSFTVRNFEKAFAVGCNFE